MRLEFEDRLETEIEEQTASKERELDEQRQLFESTIESTSGEHLLLLTEAHGSQAALKKVCFARACLSTGFVAVYNSRSVGAVCISNLICSGCSCAVKGSKKCS